MNKRLIKGILFDLNNVASYNNCGLDRLVRIDENNHELGVKNVFSRIVSVTMTLN